MNAITEVTNGQHVIIGGYPHRIVARGKAGRWGCDPCDRCGKRPPEGTTTWFTCYGDLFCYVCGAGDEVRS